MIRLTKLYLYYSNHNVVLIIIIKLINPRKVQWLMSDKFYSSFLFIKIQWIFVCHGKFRFKLFTLLELFFFSGSRVHGYNECGTKEKMREAGGVVWEKQKGKWEEETELVDEKKCFYSFYVLLLLFSFFFLYILNKARDKGRSRDRRRIQSER